MQRLRSKLTYANVMVTILAFVVLAGGTAFAAAKLGKNTVGTKQLKANAVTTAKLKNGAVTGAKIKLSSVGAVPNATNAVNATTAGNASQLGGVPAGGYQKAPMWALVNGDGAIIAQSGGISFQATTGGGGYYLHFPQPVAGKALSVTPWEAWEGLDPGVEASACGFVSQATTPTSVSCSQGTNTINDAFIGTWENGADKKLAFFVIVFP